MRGEEKRGDERRKEARRGWERMGEEIRVGKRRGVEETKEQKVWNERSHKASNIDKSVINLMHN